MSRDRKWGCGMGWQWMPHLLPLHCANAQQPSSTPNISQQYLLAFQTFFNPQRSAAVLCKGGKADQGLQAGMHRCPKQRARACSTLQLLDTCICPTRHTPRELHAPRKSLPNGGQYTKVSLYSSAVAPNTKYQIQKPISTWGKSQ